MDPIETIDAIFEQLEAKLCASDCINDRILSLEFAKRSVKYVAMYTHTLGFNVVRAIPENILAST